MGRALVIYESMFGNTEKVARAIARGVGQHLQVELCEVSQAPIDLAPYDLILVGGPTHAHGMTSPDTRSTARKMADDVVSQGTGIREWIDGLPTQTARLGTFGTRVKGPRVLWGSAASAAHRRLHRRGFELASSPESFLVRLDQEEVANILHEGEIERAEAWGAACASAVLA